MNNMAIPGVNLGGWLVLEKWITSNLFIESQAVDEYTYCVNANRKQLTKLKDFRNTFITKNDFMWLARNGIRAIRIPVGYWLFGDEPPYQETVSYLDLAFAWANQTNLKILIDLHGLKGSQNGRDHSGRAGKTEWHKSEDNLPQSLAVIAKLAERYSKNTALLGISLLNEPHPVIPKTSILNFYQQAYKIIRDICGQDTWIVYSDGYIPSRWKKALPRRNFSGVFVDMHHYQIFTPLDRLLPARLSLLRTQFLLPWKVKRLQKYHPVIVGEWSLALNEKRLSGRTKTERHEIALAYAAEQLSTFNRTDAWFFWTYKIQDGGTWSFRDCVEKDLLKF
jgi:glucan 1,3-beta-glucosidase